MKKLWMIGCVLMAAMAAQAQEDDEVGSPEGGRISLEVSGGGSSGVKMESDGGRVDTMRSWESSVEVEYELTVGGERPTIYKVGLEWTRDEFGGADGRRWPETLEGFGVEVSRTDIHGPRWLTHFAVTPGWRGAESRMFEEDAFGVQGVALARYAVRENLLLWMGVYADTLAEANDRVNPIMGVEWAFAPKWRLLMGVPKTGLTYAVSEAWEVGFDADLRLDTYAVDEVFLRNAGQEAGAKLDYVDVRMGLRATWKPTERTSLGIKVGTVAMRRLVYTGSGPGRRLDIEGVSGVHATVSCSVAF